MYRNKIVIVMWVALGLALVVLLPALLRRASTEQDLSLPENSTNANTVRQQVGSVKHQEEKSSPKPRFNNSADVHLNTALLFKELSYLVKLVAWLLCTQASTVILCHAKDFEWSHLAAFIVSLNRTDYQVRWGISTKVEILANGCFRATRSSFWVTILSRQTKNSSANLSDVYILR